MIKIAPSILSADFGILAEEIARVEAAGADQLHIDVMDGRFVPNITMGFPILDAIRKRTRLPLDLHLMIVEPEKYLAEFAARGADMLTVHVEACPHLQRTLVGIRELSARRGAPVRSGAALNPSTHPSTLDYVLDDLDLVLVMSVNPGFGGQKLIPAVYPKIRQIRAQLGARPSPRRARRLDPGRRLRRLRGEGPGRRDRADARRRRLDTTESLVAGPVSQQGGTRTRGGYIDDRHAGGGALALPRQIAGRSASRPRRGLRERHRRRPGRPRAERARPRRDLSHASAVARPPRHAG
jgi:ribulose-phosphate 3-epimerase